MKKVRFVLLATCALFSATSVLAQEAGDAAAVAAAPDTTDGNDIVVTALRRSERLQDVPVSVTALGGGQLADRQIDSAADIVSLVPNLQAATTVGEGVPIFSLRGVSMSDFSLNQQGPVATYFDEVYKGSFPLLPLAMFDLERVEVLRGPQGTLYGKNTTGGAINIISRKPGYDTEGYLRLGYGNYDRMEAEGAVQTALGDKAAARIAFTFARADGWLKNSLPGASDANATRQYGIRGSLLIEPTEDLEIILRASTSLQNPTNYGIVARPGPLGTGAGAYEAFGQGSSYFRTGLGDREIESNFSERRRHRTYSGSLTANWTVSDALTLTSITSYDRGKLYIPEDADGSPLRVLEDTLFGRAKQFAQDVRLTSDFDGPLNFILGGYYNREKIFSSTNFRFFNDIDVDGDGQVIAADCAVDFFTACQYRNRFNQTRDSKAVYSDLTFDISDAVTLRGGLRYTIDKGRLSNFNAQVLGADDVPIANTIPGSLTDIDATTGARFNDKEFTGRVGIDFKTAAGHLIYANYSRGYRASAFNAQAFFLPEEVNVARPETVDSFEVGFKSQFFDRKLTFNAAGFYYSYKNQQVLNVDPNTVAQTLINLPKSRIYGAEFELTLRPTDDLTLNGGLGLLKTKIREGDVSGASLIGNRLPNAPTVSLTAGFDWTAIHFSAGSIALRGDMSYTSKQYFELFNTDRIAENGYALINTQVAFTSDDEQWGLSLWARNLFDKKYLKSAIDVSGSGFDFTHVGEPRTYGATVNFKF
jgi:iron complex outermembrane receptor protein